MMSICRASALVIATAMVWGCSGSGDDGTTGRDAGGSVGRDAGGDGDRDGGVIDVACNPDFAMADACGGNLEGTWNYEAGCAESPVAQAITGVCATAVIQVDRFENGTGMLTVTQTAFNLAVTTNVHVEADVPVSCTQGLGCGVAKTAIEAALSGGTATCTAAGTNCSCVIDGPVTTTSMGTVTTSGGVATVNGSDTYYYCVAGDKMQYRRFDNGNNPVFVLSK